MAPRLSSLKTQADAYLQRESHCTPKSRKYYTRYFSKNG